MTELGRMSSQCAPLAVLLRKHRGSGGSPGAYAGQLARDQARHFVMGRVGVPDQEPQWNCNSWEGTEAGKLMTQCV